MRRPSSRAAHPWRGAVTLVIYGALGLARAQSESSMEEVLDFLAEERVTTAGKMEQRAARVAATVSIVTREDIRLSGATTLPDLLRFIPGIDAIDTLASNSSFGIRGFADPIVQSMIVLIDGRTTYLDFLGSTFFEAMPIALEEIERIEIIRGPSSTLWGAGAAAGVVNIITRRPKDLAGTTIAITEAQYRTHQDSIIQAGQHGRFGYSLSAGYSGSNFWDDRDEKAYGNPRSNLKLGWDLEAAGTLEASAGYARMDGPINSDLGLIDRDGALSHLMATYERGGLTVRSFLYRTDTNVKFALFKQTANVLSDAYSLDAFHTWSFARQKLTAGGEVRRLTADSELVGGNTYTQTLESLYAEDVLQLGSRAEATLGLRYDHHPLTSPQLSPRAGIVFEPWRGHFFRANYATAFRNPALSQFYLEGTVDVPYRITLLPNLDLEPERIKTAEIGYRYTLEDRLSLDATVFWESFYDIIFFNPVGYIPGTSLPNAFQEQNAFGSHAGKGGELEIHANMTKQWKATLAYTYQDVGVVQTSGAPERWPRHKIAAILRYVRPSGFEGQIAAQHVTTWSVEEGELPAFTSVSAKVGYSFLDGKLALHAFGQNLLDEQHKEFPLGETLRRKLGASVTFRMP